MVTNAPRANAVAMLAAAGLADRLPRLVIGEECARPKPDPAPYRRHEAPSASPRALRRLRGLALRPGAARAAGAQVFGLTTGLSAAELLQAGAHAAIADFTDPALLGTSKPLKASVA